MTTRWIMRILKTALLLMLLLLALLYWQGTVLLNAPLRVTPSHEVVELLPGQSFRSFARSLERDQIIESALFLELLYRGLGASPVRAGEYRLENGMRPQDLLKKLEKGEVIHYPFTIIEGTTLKDIEARIRQLPKLAHYEINWADPRLCEPIRGTQPSIEGLLLPETYFYVKNDTPESLLTRACQSMEQVLKEAWEKRVTGLPLSSPYDALIMASLVERETAYGPERPLIAGVFYHRIARNMRLQTDPTVIYGLGENYTGKLSHEDLLIDTPYNTYTRSGMPPTPIGCPSREAILAALHPEQTSFLFFVAKKDGSHIFADTYEMHLDNVAHYLKGEEKKQ